MSFITNAQSFVPHADVTNMLHYAVSGSMGHGSAGLAAGTCARTIDLGAMNFRIGDKVYYHAALNEQAITASTLATGYQKICAICVDAAGTHTFTYGTAVDATTGTPLLPDFDTDVACVGAIKVVNTSGSNFVFGTNNLATTTGIVVTFYNLCGAFPGMAL